MFTKEMRWVTSRNGTTIADPVNGFVRLVRHAEIELECRECQQNTDIVGYTFCDADGDILVGYDICCACVQCDGCFWACPDCGLGNGNL
jgi:hypothetical protein